MSDEDEIAEVEIEEDDDKPSGIADRKQDISKRPSIRKALLDIFADVEQGFADQSQRSDDQMDYWDVYNCRLGPKQFYTGNSQIYVPIVRNAIDARKTRFANQVFPQSGRYVEVTSEDGEQPYALMALLEDYVRKARLRTLVPALLRNGDIEGQYNVYVGWKKTKRFVTWRTKSKVVMDEGLPNLAAGEVEDIGEDEIEAQRPFVEIIHDCDVLVLPQTSDSLEDALDAGGSVTILRRWRKGKIKAMIKEGAIRKDAGEDLIKRMSGKSERDKVNAPKKMVDAAGVHGDDTKYAVVYETWCYLKYDGEERICQAFYGGDDNILGARRNPNWSDKLPLISVPVEKVAGAFKGQSKVKPCIKMQYAANDAVNEAWDSAAYALMPIVMTNPEKQPKVGSMVLSLAAVWETSPKDTQFAEFPQLWQHGFEMVNACKAEIAQTLSVSPAAITQGMPASLKYVRPNQAQIANEQQIDILTTADAVTVIEEGILTPMLARFIELDHQYREDDITVRQYGQMGLEASMEQIPPIQMDRRWQFRWFGVEQARNAQQVQQQIAGMNVIRGIPPQQLNGYTINLVPIISQLVENTFGPRLAPLIFQSPADQMPVPVEQENMLLAEGFAVPTHALDDDNMHIQGHVAALQMLQGGKNARKFQAHVFEHMQQAARKVQAAMAMGAAGAPGIPGGEMGGQQQPGVAGTPRIGAQPGAPRSQGPPGMIHRDQLDDPTLMPRVRPA